MTLFIRDHERALASGLASEPRSPRICARNGKRYFASGRGEGSIVEDLVLEKTGAIALRASQTPTFRLHNSHPLPVPPPARNALRDEQVPAKDRREGCSVKRERERERERDATVYLWMDRCRHAATVKSTPEWRRRGTIDDDSLRECAYMRIRICATPMMHARAPSRATPSRHAAKDKTLHSSVCRVHRPPFLIHFLQPILLSLRPASPVPAPLFPVSEA